MQIVLFHRNHSVKKLRPQAQGLPSEKAPAPDKSANSPALPPNIEVVGNEVKESAQSSGNQSSMRKPDAIGLSEFKYQVKQAQRGLMLTVEAKYNGTIPVKKSVVVPLKPWTKFSLFYYPNSSTVSIVDSAALNPTRSHIEHTQENFIARMIVTDTEALVYLRGRFPAIPGFKNVIVADDQDSTIAFAKYSSKAKRFNDQLTERMAELGKIDTFKQVSYLEAQVDVLTKVILASGIVKDTQLRDILKEADRYSQCSNANPAELRKKLQYKQFVRSLDKMC